MRWVVVGVLLLGGCGGPVDPALRSFPRGPRACIEVSPAELSFGRVWHGATSEAQVITLSSVCELTLQLLAVELGGQSPECFGVYDLQDVVLREGEETTMLVDFTALQPTEVQARLLIESNDPEDPTVAVRLRGEGVAW